MKYTEKKIQGVKKKVLLDTTAVFEVRFSFIFTF